MESRTGGLKWVFFLYQRVLQRERPHNGFIPRAAVLVAVVDLLWLLDTGGECRVSVLMHIIQIEVQRMRTGFFRCASLALGEHFASRI